MQPNTLITVSFASKQGLETINNIVASIAFSESSTNSQSSTPTTRTYHSDFDFPVSPREIELVNRLSNISNSKRPL